MDILAIQEKIKEFEMRNARVELDKAWEISVSRRLCIALITYMVAVAWLAIINEDAVWLKAIVPVAGYALSTLSLPAVKRHWVRMRTSL